MTDARACNRWFVTLVIMPALLGCSIPSQKQTASAPAPATEMEPATKPEATSTAPTAVDRLAVLRPRSPRPRSLNHELGIEGDPVPLDSTDPKYRDYFDVLRRQIQQKWSYPHEAGEKNVGGSLLIEFGIRKDGQLQFIEVQRSSGVAVLDDYALRAVREAAPFPPVPEPLLRGTGLPVGVWFNYVIEKSWWLDRMRR